MIKEEFDIIHKDFRKFLREVKLKNTTSLNSLIKAAEDSLLTLVKSEIDDKFDCLYACTDIDTLLSYQVIIEQHKEWHVQHNGHTSMKVIGYYIQYVAQKQGLDLTHYKPSKPSYYLEGDVVESHGTRYERDPKAKRDCIAKYGCKCFICGFDFEKVYGEDGAGFIEVHHLKPISAYSGEHLVIPTEDLRPLCSNCHSMVHRRRPIPWDVEKVREMIEINNADILHS